MRNRSAPPASVTPVLSYPDVAAAVEWLTHTFGFVEHLRIGDHRAQLGFGDGALIVADESQSRRAPTSDGDTHSVMSGSTMSTTTTRGSAPRVRTSSAPRRRMRTASASTPSSTPPGIDGPSHSPSPTWAQRHGVEPPSPRGERLIETHTCRDEGVASCR